MKNPMVSFVMTIITGVLYGGAVVLSFSLILSVYCLVLNDWSAFDYVNLNFPLLFKMGMWLCIGWCVLIACYLLGSAIEKWKEKRSNNP